ncbi:MAG: glycosyltransferase family 2 protein [Betaproteobacteria bacterium]
MLDRTLAALDAAIACAAAGGLIGEAAVTIVDNDTAAGAPVAAAYALPFPAESTAAWLRRAGQGNIGYGGGHNLVLREREADVYLVLNPDAVLAREALLRGLTYLRDTPPCGLVAPFAAGPDGAPQFLCKRYPDVLTLKLRAIAPKSIRHWFARRLARYELRDVVGAAAEKPATGVPLASGCCMLLRGDAVRRTQGFDPAFFVYFEDYDLSLRLAVEGASRIDYVPAMRIVHYGGNAAKKSLAHIRMFAAGALRFFNKHGWRFA